jgi:hypothetical protein
MGVTQHVDESDPFKVNDSLFNNKFHLQKPFNHEEIDCKSHFNGVLKH